ncbi:MAG: SgcJ/EcaC family oxidoreductase [Verrucomicrobiota bacterium]|nr:SgcJ/EcaC family oxidoreductase [Verrucomicrobiota bacterium]
MKTAVLLLALFTFAIQPAKALDSAARIEAIRQALNAFAIDWSKHDATGMASLWMKDGDFISAFGRIARGRGAIEGHFREQHAGIFRESRMKMIIGDVRFFQDTVAFVDSDVWVEDIRFPAGSPTDISYHIAWIIVQQADGNWKVAVSRPYVFLQWPKGAFPPPLPSPAPSVSPTPH